jgi:hypothetical protein
LLDATLDLCHRVHAEFKYDRRATTVSTPVTQVLQSRSGVCQDFAHFTIACLRSLGLAARYVSGYIVTEPPPGQPRQVGADASHAWVSAFVPGTGWMDVDPTQGGLADEGHITVAWARDYDDVAPLKGILIGGRQQSLRVAVDVVPVSDGDRHADRRAAIGGSVRHRELVEVARIVVVDRAPGERAQVPHGAVAHVRAVGQGTGFGQGGGREVGLEAVVDHRLPRDAQEQRPLGFP